MMLPRVKQYEKGEGLFTLAPVFPATADGRAAATVLSLLLPAVSASVATTPTVTLQGGAYATGAYRLSVSKEGVSLSYGDYEGLRNALATLAALRTAGGFRTATVVDSPACAFRSAMLDLARGYVELPVLREHIVRMARLKYNYLHLHLMDNESYVMESSVVPNPAGHRQYTKAELRELCDLCRTLAIEVIPEIEFPTHATNLLLALPALSCDIIDMEKAKACVAVPRVKQSLVVNGVSAWALCLGQDRTYEIYDRIIAEVAAVFPGEYLHVGGDEIAYPHLGAVPNWDNCRACRARMEKEGLTDTLALYHDGFRRLHALVTARGKRMIKWNEQAELAAPPPLPRDIVIEYWKPSHITGGKTGSPPDLIAAEKQMLTEAGFAVINTHYFYTYGDENGYMSAEKMNAWLPKADCPEVIGGETCAWELGNPEYAFYAYRLPLAMALFSDRLWNTDTVPYDEGYRADLFAAVLGSDALGTAPMMPLPHILPPVPRGRAEGGIPPITAAIPSALAALRGVEEGSVYGSLFLAAYRDYLASLV